MSGPVQVAVALGSNLGERRRFIERACDAIAGFPRTRVLRRSRLHETEPEGGPSQGPYLNGVLTLETRLSARDLLDSLLAVETELGRVRRERNGPRVIDLDLILYGEHRIDEPGLQVPHPRAHQRAFVLEPLAEVAAHWRHPSLQCSVAELWRRCRDQDAGAVTVPGEVVP